MTAEKSCLACDVAASIGDLCISHYNQNLKEDPNAGIDLEEED